MTIVINTPNSHIGRRVTERLLDSEMPVSIITRNPDKVRDLAVQGASLLVGSCDDEELLSRAFEGAEAVFWLTPPNYRPDYQSWVRDTASKAATALHDARVEHIVNVSSIAHRQRVQHRSSRRAEDRADCLSGRGREHFERSRSQRGALAPRIVHGESPCRRSHDRERGRHLLTASAKRADGNDRDTRHRRCRGNLSARL